MSKKPLETTDSHLTPIGAFELLDDDKDRLYVDMAVNGYTYKHIAVKSKMTHETVKHWFDRSGRLHEAYKQRLKEHRAEYSKQFKLIDRMLKELSVDAVLKLGEAVKSSGVWPTHIMAAKDILSRAGFDPVDKTEGSMTVKTDAAMVQAAKDLQEYVATITKTNKD